MFYSNSDMWLRKDGYLLIVRLRKRSTRPRHDWLVFLAPSYL